MKIHAALLHLLICVLLSGCFVLPQKTGSSTPTITVQNQAGGDGDAIHGGDPHEAMIDEMLSRLGTLLGKIDRHELNNRLGLAPESCETQPLGTFCESLNLTEERRAYLETFVEGAAPGILALLRDRSQLFIRFTRENKTVRGSDGQQREVLAWTDFQNGKHRIFLNDSVRVLEPARMMALLAHELLHAAGRVEDQDSIPLFPSVMGDGRRLADTAGSALATWIYLRDLAKRPTLVGLYSIGTRVAEIRRIGTGYQLINEYGDRSDSQIEEVDGTFVIHALDWHVTGRMDYKGKIFWDNDTSWAPHPYTNELLALVGTYSFQGTCRVERVGGTLRFINENGGVSTASYLGGQRVIAEDWARLGGAILGDGSIAWDNGSLWRRNP